MEQIINEFLETYQNQKTKDKYTRSLAYLLNYSPEIFKDQRKIIEAVDRATEKPVNQKRDFLIPTIEILKRRNEKFEIAKAMKESYEKQYFKEKNERENPRTPVRTSEPPVPVLTRARLLEIISTIENLDDKLLLSFYVKYPIRSDVFLLKHSGFEVDYTHVYLPGFVSISKCIKTGRAIEFKVDEETEQLIETQKESEYIIKYAGDRRGTSGGITKKINRLCKKYFGKSLGINDFRRMNINNMEEENVDLTEEEQIERRVELAERMGHSLGVQQTHYRRIQREMTVSEAIARGGTFSVEGITYEIKMWTNSKDGASFK